MLIFCSWHPQSKMGVWWLFPPYRPYFFYGTCIGAEAWHLPWILGAIDLWEALGRQKIADTNMTLQPESSKQITWCTIRGWCRWQRCSCGFWCLPWPAVWRCRAGLALSMAEEEGPHGHHTQDCRWSWSNHRHAGLPALETRERNTGLLQANYYHIGI